MGGVCIQVYFLNSSGVLGFQKTTPEVPILLFGGEY